MVIKLRNRNGQNPGSDKALTTGEREAIYTTKSLVEKVEEVVCEKDPKTGTPWIYGMRNYNVLLQIRKELNSQNTDGE